MNDALAMVAIGCLLVGTAAALYTFLLYPGSLYLLGAARPVRYTRALSEWPTVTITLPVYNEEHTVARTLDHLLALEYPRDRLEVLVVSDGSTDRTDPIVSGYAARGVRFHRLAKRSGKTTAENTARKLATGQIIVNTDASVRIPPASLKALVGPFADPEVGVASGRDVSVGSMEDATAMGEGGYVGYEMWVRELETRTGGIIGTSGCFFATRARLCEPDLPAGLSWDFVAALTAKEKGYRTVSVPEAVCYVPRTSSLRQEYRRKVRTMARGMRTLYYKRDLLNPFRHGLFAWKLFSHKICRWALPWFLSLAVLGLGLLSVSVPAARWLFVLVSLVALFAGAGWFWPGQARMPRIFALPAFAVAGVVAAVHAALKAVRGERTAVWEPTRRRAVGAS